MLGSRFIGFHRRKKCLGAGFAVLGILLSIPAGFSQESGMTANPLVSSSAAAVSPTALFAHLAIGGGYTTVFTFLNTGSEAVVGNLYLTDQTGVPLPANLDGSPGSSLPLSIPSGGTKFVTAGPLIPNDPATKAGWARVESAGGSLGGVATFQLVKGGSLSTIAGVLSSSAVTVATIPVDDDIPGDRYTGFAVANPGSSTITISIQTVNADGTAAKALPSITLKSGEQTAAFVFQSAGYNSFHGSVVLIGQSGASFSIVALVQNSGLFTAIPVIPEKAPNIK
jgi:hypothetical protein